MGTASSADPSPEPCSFNVPFGNVCDACTFVSDPPLRPPIRDPTRVRVRWCPSRAGWAPGDGRAGGRSCGRLKRPASYGLCTARPRPIPPLPPWRPSGGLSSMSACIRGVACVAEGGPPPVDFGVPWMQRMDCRETGGLSPTAVESMT